MKQFVISSLAAGAAALALATVPLGAQQAPPVPPRATAYATAPDIPFESVPNFLKLPPDRYLGEGIGVALGPGAVLGPAIEVGLPRARERRHMSVSPAYQKILQQIVEFLRASRRGAALRAGLRRDRRARQDLRHAHRSGGDRCELPTNRSAL